MNNNFAFRHFSYSKYHIPETLSVINSQELYMNVNNGEHGK